jgi:hypothetical protein
MKKNSVGLLELETADLECFLEKTPLSPLGVKDCTFILSKNDEIEYVHRERGGGIERDIHMMR